MTDPAIIRRIAALLAKGRRTDNPAEAVAFLEGAQRLLRQHNLSMADVDPEVAKAVVFDRIVKNQWRFALVQAAAHICSCRSVIFRGFVFFVGREGDRITAVHMARYLVDTVAAAAKAHAARFPAGRARNMQRRSFAFGMSRAIHERALTLLNDPAGIAAATALLGDRGTTKRIKVPVNEEALAAGAVAGQAVSFARQAAGRSVMLGADQ